MAQPMEISELSDYSRSGNGNRLIARNELHDPTLPCQFSSLKQKHSLWPGKKNKKALESCSTIDKVC